MRSRYHLRGDRVRQLLDENNLTVTAGARRLGVCRSYFSQLLAGARTLSPKVRRHLLSRAPFKTLTEAELWALADAEASRAP